MSKSAYNAVDEKIWYLTAEAKMWKEMYDKEKKHKQKIISILLENGITHPILCLDGN